VSLKRFTWTEIEPFNWHRERGDHFSSH